MHDLATIQRMNREAALAAITESVTEADEVAEREAAMRRHPAGKRLAEPAIDPATKPEQDERTTKPLKPAEAAHLASASAHELARKVLAGFTKNGEIPFALSGQAALDIIAVAIEADRAQRPNTLVEVDDCHIQGILDRWNDAREGDSADAEYAAAGEMADMLESIHASTVRS